MSTAKSKIDELVKERVAMGMPRTEALARVLRARPDLHKALLVEANPDQAAHLEETFSERFGPRPAKVRL